jgi:formiminoglutamate deiminase
VTTWWARHAWLGGNATAAGVVLEAEAGRFTRVDPGVAAPPAGARVLEGLTLPGFANAHSHAFHRALRARTHDRPGSFWSWRDLMYEVADRLDPDGYRRLARAVYAEMALAGYTAVGEFHYLHHGPGGVPYDDPNQMGLALVEAAAEAGIRITLLDTCYLRGDVDTPLAGVQRRFGDAGVDGWVERVSGLTEIDGAAIGAAIHSVRAVDAKAAAVVSAWAGDRAAPLHAHVSEQRREHETSVKRCGRTPLQLLDRAGALGPAFTAVHGTHFDEKDVERLAAAGGGCCACPTTERDLGDGIGPFAALAAAGVRLCLGSDSHAVVDPLEEARALEVDGRASGERRGVFTPDALLRAATVDGMAALGWDSGRLAPGTRADFVVVGLDGARTAGCDPGQAATAVFAATAADVTDVVVGGRPVVEAGHHRTVGDVVGALSAAVGAVVG